tara:strand:- start:282 stop:1184 length:903 start_codon:yes stop_codon:yes gene_type:complete
MNLSLTVTSDFNSSPLLFELDFDNYNKERIHFNILLKTNNEVLKKMYLSYKDFWDSSGNKCDPYKDTGIPLFVPESKVFKSKTITEVDFEIEMICYYKYKVNHYGVFMKPVSDSDEVCSSDDEHTHNYTHTHGEGEGNHDHEDEHDTSENHTNVKIDCGCEENLDENGNLHTDENGNTIISKDDYKIIRSQPFHSGLDQSRFIPLAYYLQSHQSIYSNSLLMMNTTKLVDRGYRGNLKAYFYNASDNDIVLNVGEKLGLVVPTFHSYLYEINIFGQEENMQDPTKRQDDIHINYYPNDYL